MEPMQALHLIEKTIRRAGTLLLDLAASPPEVLSSAGRDIKLQADRDSEKLIVDALRAESAWPILGEEGGEYGEGFEGRYWVIDPLDGTLNFSRGIPICCVSVALMEGTQPLAAAIYDFNRDEMFTAIARQGAWLNGRPMYASDRTDPAQGALSTGFPSYTDFSTEALMPIIRRVQMFKKVRMIGSAAISLAWVACGRVDAYVEDDIMLWDVAAGMLLVREAGGVVQLRESSKDKWARCIRTAGRVEMIEGV